MVYAGFVEDKVPIIIEDTIANRGSIIGVDTIVNKAGIIDTDTTIAKQRIIGDIDTIGGREAALSSTIQSLQAENQALKNGIPGYQQNGALSSGPVPVSASAIPPEILEMKKQVDQLILELAI